MIISFTCDAKLYNFCVPLPLLKLVCVVLLAVSLMAGYCIVQLSAFILSATPEQFIRIVIFTAFTIITVVVIRLFLHKKAGIQ